MFSKVNGIHAPQLTRVAAERSAEKRLDYIARIGVYTPEQLIFVDESSVDRRTTYQGHAWSIRGTKAQRKAFLCVDDGMSEVLISKTSMC